MSTTTIRLSEALKARVALAADGAGTTVHNFILEAIAEKAEAVERRRAFVAEARVRYAAIVAGGTTLEWKAERTHWLAAQSSGTRRAR